MQFCPVVTGRYEKGTPSSFLSHLSSIDGPCARYERGEHSQSRQYVNWLTLNNVLNLIHQPFLLTHLTYDFFDSLLMNYKPLMILRKYENAEIMICTWLCTFQNIITFSRLSRMLWIYWISVKKNWYTKYIVNYQLVND